MKNLIKITSLIIICFSIIFSISCNKDEHYVTEKQWNQFFKEITNFEVDFTYSALDRNYSSKSLYDGGKYAAYLEFEGREDLITLLSFENDKWYSYYDMMDAVFKSASEYEEAPYDFRNLLYSEFTYDDESHSFKADIVTIDETKEYYSMEVSFTDGLVDQITYINHQASSDKDINITAVFKNYGTTQVTIPEKVLDYDNKQLTKEEYESCIANLKKSAEMELVIESGNYKSVSNYTYDEVCTLVELYTKIDDLEQESTQCYYKDNETGASYYFYNGKYSGNGTYTFGDGLPSFEELVWDNEVNAYKCIKDEEVIFIYAAGGLIFSFEQSLINEESSTPIIIDILNYNVGPVEVPEYVTQYLETLK